MIKNYFQLVRIPGVFTIFSNIILGVVIIENETVQIFQILILVVSSILLYMGGMILNDYFDFEIDKKERPTRPLPSKKISRKTALKISIFCFTLANVFTIFIDIDSFIISGIMSILIISYNISFKKIRILGIITLSIIRMFNVALGSSIGNLHFESIQYIIPIGIYIAGISYLAKNECTVFSFKKEIFNDVFLLVGILFIIVLIIDEYNFISIIILCIFLIFTLYPKLKYRKTIIENTQKKITFQLLGIILLDATIISIFLQDILLIVVILLYIPAYMSTRKLYFT